MKLLTQSRIKAARSCQRKHRLRYELGYSAIVELGGRKFGKLMHTGLEAYWNARKERASIDKCIAAAIAAVQGAAADDPFELAKAEVLLTAYATRWNTADEGYEVIAVEAQFTCELRNPSSGGTASRTWELGGKLDVIVREISTGRIIFIEHKTSSEDIAPGSFYWRALRMDTQVSVYFDGSAALGYDAEACLYDVIGKPQIRPKGVPIVEDGARVVLDATGERVRTKDGKKWRETADTAAGYVLQTRPETVEEYRARLVDEVAAAPERFFARGEVVRFDSEMVDARQDTWDTAKQIHENETAGRAPKNPSACMEWGRPCDYFAACSGEASIDDPTLFTKSSNVHPELSFPEAQQQPEIAS